MKEAIFVASMGDKKIEILDKIKFLKEQRWDSFALNCSFDGLPYKLIFLTADRARDDYLMQLLSDWRKQHEFWFPSQFPVSLERTKKWFAERVIGAEDRLLFMVKVGDEYVGHVGLFRFSFTDLTCEIDNIVRGVNKYPGLMSNAIKFLMQWGREELFLKGYTLQTTSDNTKALSLYARLGFVETKRIPLIKASQRGQTEWTTAPEGFSGPIERYDVFMALK